RPVPGPGTAGHRDRPGHRGGHRRRGARVLLGDRGVHDPRTHRDGDRHGLGPGPAACPGFAHHQPLRRDRLGGLRGRRHRRGAVRCDQRRGLIRSDGERLPLLRPELWPAWIIALLGLLLLEAVLAVVVVLRRRWSPALATVNTALAVLFMSWALTLLGRSALV